MTDDDRAEEDPGGHVEGVDREEPHDVDDAVDLEEGLGEGGGVEAVQELLHLILQLVCHVGRDVATEAHGLVPVDLQALVLVQVLAVEVLNLPDQLLLLSQPPLRAPLLGWSALPTTEHRGPSSSPTELEQGAGPGPGLPTVAMTVATRVGTGKTDLGLGPLDRTAPGQGCWDQAEKAGSGLHGGVADGLGIGFHGVGTLTDVESAE